MSNSDAQWRSIVKKISADIAAAEDALRVYSAMAVWQRLVDKFAPLIGAGSVNLLLIRSLEINIPDYPFLAAVSAAPASVPLLQTLRTVYGAQTQADLLAVNHAVLLQFVSTLAGLIGDRLSSQFLSSTFPDFGAGEAAQENNQ